jgi:hypothetical protein
MIFHETNSPQYEPSRASDSSLLEAGEWNHGSVPLQPGCQLHFKAIDVTCTYMYMFRSFQIISDIKI